MTYSVDTEMPAFQLYIMHILVMCILARHPLCMINVVWLDAFVPVSTL